MFASRTPKALGQLDGRLSRGVSQEQLQENQRQTNDADAEVHWREIDRGHSAPTHYHEEGRKHAPYRRADIFDPHLDWVVHVHREHVLRENDAGVFRGEHDRGHVVRHQQKSDEQEEDRHAGAASAVR